MNLGIPYIIYEGTIHLRKIKGGFELVPSYTGVVDLSKSLPPVETIKHLLKRRQFKGKKARFCLIRQYPSFDGEVLDEYEVLPGWGIIASNLWGRSWDEEAVAELLRQDNVEAIIWLDEETGDISYVTGQAQSETAAQGQAEQVSDVQDAQGSTGDQ